MEPEFSCTPSGDWFVLELVWKDGEGHAGIGWRVRARPFLLRIRLFSAKRRLYRAYRKYMRCKGELDEA